MDDASLHARLTSTRRKFTAAADHIARHLAAVDRSYVSWSGGKDSTAVALLATDADPSLPLIRFSHGCDFPEVVDYCATTAERFGWDYRVVVMSTLAEHLESTRCHLFDESDANHVDPHHHELVAVELGCIPDGLLWGLRAGESTGRMWNGVHRLRADGVSTCAPLHRWSRMDVHALLASRDVPLCPVYGRLAALGCDPDRQRVGYMVGSSGVSDGRLGWLHAGWPTEWERMVVAAPWLKQFA